MAAILAVEDAAPATVRPLMLVSFENDFDSLKLALDHPGYFKHLRHPAPRALLTADRWNTRAAAIQWLLLRGHFPITKFDAPPPDVIFFDPFPFNTDTAMWTFSTFRALAHACSVKSTERVRNTMHTF